MKKADFVMQAIYTFNRFFILFIPDISLAPYVANACILSNTHCVFVSLQEWYYEKCKKLWENLFY